MKGEGGLGILREGLAFLLRSFFQLFSLSTIILLSLPFIPRREGSVDGALNDVPNADGFLFRKYSAQMSPLST